MPRENIETSSPQQWDLLKAEARQMRRSPTATEAMMWAKLRGSALGARFRRHHAIDRFIVDFVCLPAMLIVELDGSSHDGLELRDQERDQHLMGLGYRVLRFQNAEVEGDVLSVVARIRQAIETQAEPTELGSPLPAFPEAPERGKGVRSQ
jgi:very-short-patch-repair endonuclease